MRKTGALALVLLAIAFFYLRRDRREMPDPPAVVAQIRQLNELATVRYTVQKVVGIREPKYPVGEESILLVVQASVTAGVDLSTLTPENVKVDGGTVTVHLPEPRILSATIDEKETKVWDRAKTWWTPWVPYSKDLEGRARQQGIDAAREAAVQMGILTQASRNAESSIRTLLSLAGAKTVRVVRADLS